jgi:TonB family protein
MAAITYDEPSFARYFGYSAWLHIAIGVALVAGTYLTPHGEAWGGIGGGGGGGGGTSVSVSLVGNVGIPMPNPTVPATAQVVDVTKGLGQEEPRKEEPKTDSVPIQKFGKYKQLPPSKPSKVFENKTPLPPNAIPYGRGGQLNIPSGYSENPGPYSGGVAGGAAGGVAVQGQGGGQFAGRYAWYVESVRRAISQNWIQSTIDPSVRAARRAKTTLTFRIYRNGSIGNIRLDTSSGNRSMDDSCTRALLNIDKFPALPVDYSGSYVDVTFDFDLALTK